MKQSYLIIEEFSLVAIKCCGEANLEQYNEAMYDVFSNPEYDSTKSILFDMRDLTLNLSKEEYLKIRTLHECLVQDPERKVVILMDTGDFKPHFFYRLPLYTLVTSDISLGFDFLELPYNFRQEWKSLHDELVRSIKYYPAA